MPNAERPERCNKGAASRPAVHSPARPHRLVVCARRPRPTHVNTKSLLLVRQWKRCCSWRHEHQPGVGREAPVGSQGSRLHGWAASTCSSKAVHSPGPPVPRLCRPVLAQGRMRCVQQGLRDVSLCGRSSRSMGAVWEQGQLGLTDFGGMLHSRMHQQGHQQLVRSSGSCRGRVGGRSQPGTVGACSSRLRRSGKQGRAAWAQH